MSEENLNDLDDNLDWGLQPPYHKFVWLVIKSAGWYIVGFIVILIYTWPYVQKTWKSWKKKKDDMEYAAKYHKDVDFNTERLLATQLARERMQEKYLRDREIALQKEEERKERKRQELLKLQGQLSGYRLDGNSNDTENTNGASSSSKSKLKKDYNPLMGNQSNGRYVPPKRSCCGRGGCG